MLSDSDLGFTVQNGVQYTFSITNTIEIKRHKDTTKKSTFAYTLGSSQDGHQNIDYGDMHEVWDSQGDNIVAYFSAQNNPPIRFTQVGAGVNVNLSPFIFLNEAFVVPYEGCWFKYSNSRSIYQTLKKVGHYPFWAYPNHRMKDFGTHLWPN